MEIETNPVTNEIESLDSSRQLEGPRLPMKLNMDVNLGINLSILVILVIFAGLLFLPSKMLLDTSYEVPIVNEIAMRTRNATNYLYSMKFREKKLCPGLDYEYWLSSIFFSNYDRNCSWMKKHDIIADGKLIVVTNRERNVCTSEREKISTSQNYNHTIGDIRGNRPKTIPVTSHILATMLVVSAIAAFVEVLRIRFIDPKDSSAVENASSRKGSTVELMPTRRFFPRETMKSQRSFDLQGVQKSALGLLGNHPPPLIRRSSFPTYRVNEKNLSTTLVDVSTTPSMSRRTSTVNAEHTIPHCGMTNLHRRTRLIRRH